MQGDAKAGVKRALDHALTMHLQDLGRRKAAHQGLAHAGRIGTGLGCKQQGLGHGLDVQGHDDLVRYLGSLAIAIAANKSDVFAHKLEHWLDALEGGVWAADHDGKGGIFGAHLAAGDRRVQVVAAQGVDLLRKHLGLYRRD